MENISPWNNLDTQKRKYHNGFRINSGVRIPEETDKFWRRKIMDIKQIYGFVNEATEEALGQIPSDASVTAYGYIAPHLYYVDDLHSSPEYYGDYEKTDYYVIDTRYARDEHTQKMYDAMGDDYSLLCETGYIKIYRLIGQER